MDKPLNIDEPLKDIEVNLPEPPKEKKTRKPRTKKEDSPTNEADPILMANIFALAKAITHLVSIKAGKIWEFSDEECEAISKPAARIAARMGALEASSKYTDYIMLGLAVALPVGGRILVTKNVKKDGNNGGTKRLEEGTDKSNRPVYPEKQDGNSIERSGIQRFGGSEHVGNVTDQLLPGLM